MLWVVCYDITDDRQRLDVAHALEDVGARVQKSVFEVEASVEAVGRLAGRLEALIDPRTDDLRYYPLCAGCRRRAGAAGTSPADSTPRIAII
jgi:CRISPR-associated protein Cas2